MLRHQKPSNMAPKVCMTKLKKEMKAFLSNPPPHIPSVHVNERNMLEWHFLLEGPPETPYAGGWYIGKLRFPPEYPFKPPAIMMLTPSGRFATGTRLCLSMSDFHPESWNPMWTVSSILTGLLSFMIEDQITTGSLKTTDAEKQQFAAASLDYNLQHAQLKSMFQQELQTAKCQSNKTTEPSSSQVLDAAQSTDAQVAQTADDLQSRDQPDVSSAQQPATHASAANEPPTTSAAAMRLSNPDLDLQHAVPPADQSDFLGAVFRRIMEGQPERALSQIDDVLRRQQHKDLFHSSLLLLKAQALAVTGDLKAADEAVQAWELQPERPCQTALRMPSRQKGGPAQWRQDWSACIIAKDKGNDLFRKGDFAGALKAYEQSLVSAPECSIVLCNEAAALAKLERHADAVAAAKQALKLNSEYDKAQRRMHDSKAALRKQ